MSESVHDDSVRRIRDLPCWSTPVSPEPISGGITNRNYRVDDGAVRYFVRLGENIAHHGIRRTHEVACSRAAALAGVGPDVVYTTKGALVVQWIEGRTFEEADVRDPENLDRILALLDRLFRDGAARLRGRAPFFWVFHVIREYGHFLLENDFRLAGRVTEIVEEVHAIDRTLNPVRIALCHNDLLAANFIDDGNRLWLVDWEYAGFNTPLFDLANLASNNDLPSEQQSRLAAVAADSGWLDGDAETALTQLKALACTSLAREAMWSMVQEIRSTLDVNYEEYTAVCLSRYDAAHGDWLQHR